MKPTLTLEQRRLYENWFQVHVGIWYVCIFFSCALICLQWLLTISHNRKEWMASGAFSELRRSRWTWSGGGRYEML